MKLEEWDKLCNYALDPIYEGLDDWARRGRLRDHMIHISPEELKKMIKVIKAAHAHAYSCCGCCESPNELQEALQELEGE